MGETLKILFLTSLPSLATNALRACEAGALRRRKTLTPRFTGFFTDFEKQNYWFAVYYSIYKWGGGGGQTKNLAKSNESVRSSFLLFIGDPIPTENIKYPCVVKASKGEDSKSVRLVKDKQSLDAAIKHALTYSNQVIIERYRLSRSYSSKT